MELPQNAIIVRCAVYDDPVSFHFTYYGEKFSDLLFHSDDFEPVRDVTRDCSQDFFIRSDQQDIVEVKK